MSTVLLSGIPKGCQEADIHRALLMYGTAVNIQVHPHGERAVVTMRTPQESHALLNRHNVSILGTTVRVDSMNGSPLPLQHSQPPAPHMHYNHNSYDGGMSGAPHYHPSQPHPDSIISQPTNRLRVHVEECRYPVTRDVFMQMFSMIAPPTYVYCGPSGMTTTGTVEFADVASAERAMRQFNNNAIYPGCCFVKLSYEQSQPPPQPQSMYGGRGGFAQSAYGGAGPGYFPPPAARMPVVAQGTRGVGRGMRGGRGGPGMARGFEPYNQYPQSNFAGRPGPAQPMETTVIISNVSEAVPLFDLWTLLEVYGNVNSLKRQYKDKTNVVAQFQSAQDAKAAVFFLQNCMFRGSSLGLKVFVGYQERGGRVEWNAGPATDPATQAVMFTSGFHHRTRPNAPFNPIGRVRPDKNLFISNLVEAITDEEVKGELDKLDDKIESYYRKNATVAIVSCKDIETAVNVLIRFHAKQLRERFLRVTFSRYPPGPRPDGEHDDGDEENAGQAQGGECPKALGEAAATEVTPEAQPEAPTVSAES